MMPWWPKDYISATRAKRLAERGAYCDLLFFQWELGVLPKDPSMLARLLGVGQEEFDDVWPAIQDKFVETEGGLVNLVLEKHREKAIHKRDGFRRGAAKTNAARAPSDPPSGDGMGDPPSDPPSTPHPSPSPSPLYKEVDGLNFDAWEKWLGYRSQQRLKKYTTNQIAVRLAKLPHDTQLICVDDSIAKAYQGIFPEKFGGNGSNPTYAQRLKADIDAPNE